MAYRQILWIKLEKRLLNDYRFYTLSRDAQLIYLKILMLSAETSNKIPKNSDILRSALREPLQGTEIKKCLEEIKVNFPKFKESKHFYYFVGWRSRHNWYLPSNSLATPQPVLEKKRIDKIRKEYIKLKGWQEEDLVSDDYARIHKAIKTLLLKAKDDEKALKALYWVAKQGYTDWTMETVVKKYQNTINICPKCKNTGYYTNEKGYRNPCDCPKGKALQTETNPRL